METPRLGFISGLLCDDVRTEDNGKLLIIGVYGNDIVINAKPPVPLAVSLACWINSSGPLSDAKIDVEFFFNEKLVLKGTRQFHITSEGRAYIIFPKAPITVKNEGTLAVFVVMPDGSKHEAWTGPIKFIDPSPPSTTE